MRPQIIPEERELGKEKLKESVEQKGEGGLGKGRSKEDGSWTILRNNGGFTLRRS